MATSRDILKSWFETGDKPTQEQFAALIDSLFHKSEDGWVTTNVTEQNGVFTLFFANGQNVVITGSSATEIQHVTVTNETTEITAPVGFGDAQIFVNEMPKFDDVSIENRIISGDTKIIRFNARNTLRAGWIVTFKK